MKIFITCISLFALMLGTLCWCDFISTRSAKSKGIIMCKLMQKDGRKQIIYNDKKYDLYDSSSLSKIMSLMISYDSLQRANDNKDRLLKSQDVLISTLQKKCK